MGVLKKKILKSILTDNIKEDFNEISDKISAVNWNFEFKLTKDHEKLVISENKVKFIGVKIEESVKDLKDKLIYELEERGYNRLNFNSEEKSKGKYKFIVEFPTYQRI